jgi:acetyl-CoA C-acetyltransferase
MADMGIRAGEYRRVIAGGMESMSQAPHLLRQGRTGWKYGEQSLYDAVDIDGLRCAHLGMAMGCIAEWVAKDSKIARVEQDAWSVRSHQRAMAATQAGHFESEIVPVPTMEGRNPIVRNRDENPRADCSVEGLAKLKSVFVSELVRTPDEAYDGTVTAGNASTLSDGAAAVVVVDEATFTANTSPWAFRIVGHACFAGDHRSIFTAPVGAVKSLLAKTNIPIDRIDLIEINEAFAAQTLACIDLLQLDPERVNVNGGAIAIGHPLGCSGARVLVTLMHNLIASERQFGIATLCLGGGEAVAMLIERVR